MKTLKLFLMMVLLTALFAVAKADSETLIGGETFAYGVNVITCDFTEYSGVPNDPAKVTKRKMIITGEINGATLGYLTTPNETEKDTLFVVTMLSKTECKFDGNPDNKMILPNLSSFWVSSPYRRKGGPRTIGEVKEKYTCPGILRTLYIPENTEAKTQGYFIVSNGSTQVYKMPVRADKDTHLSRVTLKAEGNWELFRTCQNSVVNMDYCDFSKYRDQAGEVALKQFPVIFTIRTAPINSDVNVTFGDGYQYTTLTSPTVSSYTKILDIKGNETTGYGARSVYGELHQYFDTHLLQGGMVGINPEGKLAYIFTGNFSKFYKSGFFTTNLYIEIYATTYSAEISQKNDGTLFIDFEGAKTARPTLKVSGKYNSKEWERSWEVRYVPLVYAVGGPTLSMEADGKFTFGTGGVAKYGAFDSSEYSPNYCGFAYVTNYPEGSQQAKRQTLYPESYNPLEQDELKKNFLLNNGRIKMMCYGLPYTLDVNKLFPTLTFELTNFSSAMNENSNGVSVEAEAGGSWGVKDLFDSSMGIMGGYSKTWGQKATTSKTRTLKINTDKDRDFYNDNGFVVYVKGTGYVSGNVELKTLANENPTVMVAGNRVSIPFITYFAQVTPSEYEVSNQYFPMQNPSQLSILEGVESRPFTNAYSYTPSSKMHGRSEHYYQIQEWEITHQLQQYIDLYKVAGSGVNKISEKEYFMNQGFSDTLSIENSKSTTLAQTWSAGVHYKTASKPGFYCDVKTLYKGSDAFTSSETHKNSFTFTTNVQSLECFDAYRLYVLNINIASLKSYLANQSYLPQTKPFFIPTMNWETNEDLIVIMSSTSQNYMTPGF